MDTFETDLAAAMRAAVQAPLTEIDPVAITASGTPRRVRSLAGPIVAALVVVAIAVTIVALTHTRGKTTQQAGSPSQSSVPSTSTQPTGGLTTAQRDLAVRIAMSEARVSGPPTASGRSGNAEDPGGWPSNVTQVTAIATSHADAMNYVGAEGGDMTPVLVVRLVGTFSWETTGPRGTPAITGNVITIVADSQSGKITDSGIEQQDPPASLPDATVLYAR
jgi:hypothetical protein